MFLILVNLFAPFSIELSKEGNPQIKKSKAEAAYLYVGLEKNKRTKTSIQFSLHIKRLKTTDNHGLIWIVTKNPVSVAKVSEDEQRDFISAAYNNDPNFGFGTLFQPTLGETTPIAGGKSDIASEQGGALDKLKQIDEITGLTPNTPYYVSFAAYNGTADDASGLSENNILSTTAIDEADDLTTEEIANASGGGYLPSCFWAIGLSVSGCIAQLLYKGLFQPTSYLFGLAGQFFDFGFFYSVSDGNYRSSFVVEGWGLVRDFVNVFFIFVLLYIAFATILSLHGFKTKEMIINVVIIGLLINFSLFATQVIIDTSNILARVFYSSIATSEKNQSTGAIENKLGANNEVQLSAKIVQIVNPQKLIIKAADVGSTRKKGDAASVETNSNGISNGTFILVTILAIAVNIVGLFVFLTVGLLFIARTLGLWLAMILVPLAFFSYTVPAMQTIDMIGWKKWWPETLKLAFLAPIFLFFMYLSIKFFCLKDFFDSKGDSGPEFVIAIIFPFAFIMVLMLKAKGIAAKFAGDIGSAVTKAGMAIGGVALGGAALTAAFAGRQTLGAVSKYVQNDGARNKDRKIGKNVAQNFKDVKGIGKWTGVGYLGAGIKSLKSIGKGSMANIAHGIHKIPGGKDQAGNKVSFGQKVQLQDEAFSKKQNATSTLDSKAAEFASKFNYTKDVKYMEMTEPQQAEVREAVDKDTISKEAYGGKKFSDLKDVAEINSVKDALSSATRDPKTGKLNFAVKTIQRDPNDGNKFITRMVRSKTGGADGGDAHAGYLKTNPVIGEFVQALRKGSMDIRNLSGMKTKSKGLLPMLGVGLAAVVASGVRSGLKNGMKIDHGTGQKDFLKDLGHTLTTALKGIKIDVKTDSGGHSEAKASGGGGH